MTQLSLDTLRNAIRTQLHGRRLGLDNTADNIAGGAQTNRGGFLVGVPGIRLPVQTIASTVPGSTLLAAGYIEVATTAAAVASVQSLGLPIQGCECVITQTATSTVGVTIASSACNFNSTFGTSQNAIQFLARGAAVHLVAISTALWAIIDYSPISTNGGPHPSYLVFSTY